MVCTFHFDIDLYTDRKLKVFTGVQKVASEEQGLASGNEALVCQLFVFVKTQTLR
jgi:hypothetical protein